MRHPHFASSVEINYYRPALVHRVASRLLSPRPRSIVSSSVAQFRHTTYCLPRRDRALANPTASPVSSRRESISKNNISCTAEARLVTDAASFTTTSRMRWSSSWPHPSPVRSLSWPPVSQGGWKRERGCARQSPRDKGGRVISSSGVDKHRRDCGVLPAALRERDPRVRLRFYTGELATETTLRDDDNEGRRDLSRLPPNFNC